MKPAPSNRDVPDWMWEAAVRQHNEYLRLHQGLMGLGLSDPQADEYLDSLQALSSALELLDPAEPDFFVGDHARTFDSAVQLLTKMRSLLTCARD